MKYTLRGHVYYDIQIIEEFNSREDAQERKDDLESDIPHSELRIDESKA